jgi:hypothetical protein
MRIWSFAAIVACALMLGLSLVSLGPASGASLPKVIQRIKWHSYTGTKAVGWGRYGTQWRCGGNLDAEQMTCVKITLSHPVTEHGITYFKTLLYQPATMGGYAGWDWHTAAYEGEF